MRGARPSALHNDSSRGGRGISSSSGDGGSSSTSTDWSSLGYSSGRLIAKFFILVDSSYNFVVFGLLLTPVVCVSVSV